MIVDRQGYTRDLRLVLKAAAERHIPVIITSAGGPGINRHVDEMIDLIHEISSEHGYRFKLAAIYADIDRVVIHNRLAAGHITECGPSGDLTHEAIDDAVNVVAQMGAEPFARVMQGHPDVDIIVSGRPMIRRRMPASACCMESTRACIGTWARSWNAERSAQSRRAA